MGKFNLTEEALRAGLLEGEFLEIQTEKNRKANKIKKTEKNSQETENT